MKNTLKFQKKREDVITEEELVLMCGTEMQGCKLTALLAAMELCLMLMVAANGNIVAAVCNGICAGVLVGVAIRRGILARNIKRVLNRLLKEAGNEKEGMP